MNIPIKFLWVQYIGVCSYIVKEISGKGLELEDLRVKLVELGFSDIPLIKNEEIVKDSIEYLQTLNLKYTIHSPTSDEECGVRVDLGVDNKNNIKIMEKVFKIASLLDVRYVVVHGGDVNTSYYKAFINTKNQLTKLSKMAEDYSVRLVIENLSDNRVGAMPHEFMPFLGDNVGMVFDTGHAFLIQQKYGVDMREYIRQLGSYIEHIHIHDNSGITDEHLALGEGSINWKIIIKELSKTNPKNIILEIRRYSNPQNVVESINALSNGFTKKAERFITQSKYNVNVAEI